MGYQNVALNSLARTIRSGQMMGTLEAMLMTPNRFSAILLSSRLWSFAFTSFEVSLYLLLGITLFGLRLDRISLAGAFLTQLLTILAFSGIGILSASFIVVFKQEAPINFLFASISGLLAGVLYPVEVLPGWLQSLSNLLPLTYSLRAMRKAVLLGDSLIVNINEANGPRAFCLYIIAFGFLFIPLCRPLCQGPRKPDTVLKRRRIKVTRSPISDRSIVLNGFSSVIYCLSWPFLLRTQRVKTTTPATITTTVNIVANRACSGPIWRPSQTPRTPTTAPSAQSPKSVFTNSGQDHVPSRRPLA